MFKFLENNPLEKDFSYVIGQKIKYETITDIRDFAKAKKELEKRKMTSITSEKRRKIIFRRTIKIPSEEKRNFIFKEIVEKNLTALDKDINLKELDKIRYVFDKESKNIKHISKYKKNEEFVFETILQDCIYTTSVRMINGKMEFTYSLLSPITLEYISLKGMLGRIAFYQKNKARWERIKREIKEMIK